MKGVWVHHRGRDGGWLSSALGRLGRGCPKLKKQCLLHAPATAPGPLSLGAVVSWETKEDSALLGNFPTRGSAAKQCLLPIMLSQQVVGLGGRGRGAP